MMRKFGKAVLAMLLGGGSPGVAAAQDDQLVERFHDAVAEGAVDAVREMLAVTPSLATSVGRFGFQPMQLQDVYFEERILDLLLAQGAEINGGNDEGVTLLHIVTEPEAVPVLIAKGADPEARDIRGWTPLIMQVSSQENGPDVVAALLEAGADPEAVGKDGKTALDMALEGDADPELIAILKQAAGQNPR
ncbi:ankyrin repeat domain-containing protein [Paracoccus caeni]|uniref:Ankyrin repeat domain-containing protein n=1 Tax=Paracoccus caeni TaxID=657651 RepID=A0A934VYK7_9RHOB|nr:ankyrin repeat domain-containing protein [Paracoccus caeni]MBK4216092.1 ankyrin repeat domain-containing protein [Paracoccus caeni]